MARLRDPVKGCPWDLEQTFKSISSYTLEEAYELYDAIDHNDMIAFKEELGDLLLHVIFYSQIAKEQSYFSFSDVVNLLAEKIIKRHPHVFDETDKLKKSSDNKFLWERKILEREQAENLLDDVTVSLPALHYAKKIQELAASVGFDWDDIGSVFSKVREELSELMIEIDKDLEINNSEEELGDVLFAVVNLARHLKLDPEIALRRSSKKFIQRFNCIKRAAEKMNKKVSDLTTTEIEKLWQKAKARQGV